MKITAGASQLLQGYEALRAQAVGQIGAITPRGLAVFHRSGMVAWMSACAPLGSIDVLVNSAPSLNYGRSDALGATSAELVQILAEMALGSHRRCYA